MNPHQSGLVFTKEEFALLLDVVKADDLIGIDQSELLPTSESDHVSSVQTGIESLLKRDLMKTDENDGKYIIKPVLIEAIKTIAQPEMIVTGTRHETEGSRFFFWYIVDSTIVEFTKPTEASYRIGSLPDAEALTNRIRFIFLGKEDNKEDQSLSFPRFTLPKDEFLKINSLLNQSKFEAAKTELDKHDIPPELSTSFIEEAKYPDYSGVIAFLRTHESNIVYGRDYALLGGQTQKWLIASPVSDPETLRCEQIDEATFHSALTAGLLQVALHPVGDATS